MGQFLQAAYQLRVKDLYTAIKENKISNRLNKADSFAANRKRITAFILPLVKKAYREGVDYASAVVKQQLNQEIEKDYSFSSKGKDKILLEFIARIMAAERIHIERMKNYRTIQALYPGLTKREDPQLDQIWKEYVNGVKAAVNNLLIRSGDEGVLSVYRKIEDQG